MREGDGPTTRPQNHHRRCRSGPAPARNSPFAPVRMMAHAPRVGEVAKGGSEGDPHIPGACVLGFGVVNDHRRDAALQPRSECWGDRRGIRRTRWKHLQGICRTVKPARGAHRLRDEIADERPHVVLFGTDPVITPSSRTRWRVGEYPQERITRAGVVAAGSKGPGDPVPNQEHARPKGKLLSQLAAMATLRAARLSQPGALPARMPASPVMIGLSRRAAWAKRELRPFVASPPRGTVP